MGNMSTSFHDRKRRENDVLQKSKGRAEKAEVHMPSGTPRKAPLFVLYVIDIQKSQGLILNSGWSYV